MAEIKDIDGAAWDTKQIKLRASFLQSYNWGKFQESVGLKAHFLSGEDWSCLLLEKTNRLGKYLFAQYGPTTVSAPALSVAMDHILDYGRQHGAAWISLEPMSSQAKSAELESIMRKFKAKAAARHRDPEMTRIVDLTPSEDDLLSGISQSTRSFIRKNSRENLITFKTSTDPSEIVEFTKMLDVVASKKNIHFYNQRYFKAMAETLMPSGMMSLEFALRDSRPVAAALFHDYGELSTYTYAASIPAGRKLNVSALLLWQGMLNAKRRGMKRLDLYGVAPDNAPPSHPWAGFTSFKAKFGGEVVSYAGTWDIGLNLRYSLYRGAHHLKRLVRR
jgi:lipid II:glycine glycyltransferase (peptidoglycan interpeptide bridge formation enzyme)